MSYCTVSGPVLTVTDVARLVLMLEVNGKAKAEMSNVELPGPRLTAIVDASAPVSTTVTWANGSRTITSDEKTFAVDFGSDWAVISLSVGSRAAVPFVLRQISTGPSQDHGHER